MLNCLSMQACLRIHPSSAITALRLYLFFIFGFAPVVILAGNPAVGRHIHLQGCFLSTLALRVPGQMGGKPYGLGCAAAMLCLVRADAPCHTQHARTPGFALPGMTVGTPPG